MSSRLTLPVLSVLALAAGGARAQTYDPAVTQRMLNQQQLDIQSQQLQQLRLQANAAPLQPDPAAAMRAAQTQMQINQLDAELNAQRAQVLTPSANPADLSARLQASGAAIQAIRPPQ